MAWTKERVQEYRKAWLKNHPGYLRKWRHKNPHKVRAWATRWEKNNRPKIMAWRKAHRHVINANNKVRNAVRGGRLIKPLHCEKCGLLKRVFGHHSDYSKPLEVIWLCYPCHLAIHNKSVRTWKEPENVSHI